MHEFSVADGFVEITESLADMIKYAGNEPSAGLFYVQQHAQNAMRNVISLRNNVANKSRETTLHSEDSEDSIIMLRSMKECGIPLASEMIRDLNKSLTIMSTKQPRRGLIRNSTSGFLPKTSSWSSSAILSQRGGKRVSYFSTIFKNPQHDSKDLVQVEAEKPQPQPHSKISPLLASSSSTDSPPMDVEADELPLSSPIGYDSQEGQEVSVNLPTPNSLLVSSENFDQFKASKEAKLELWLKGTGSMNSIRGSINGSRLLSDAEEQ